MQKIFLVVAFIYFPLFLDPLFAEVNVALLEKQYPKCENKTHRHDCFDENLYSSAKEIGYFWNNSLWDGQYFENDELIFEYVDGKQIVKSFCKKGKDGWTVCSGGDRFKALDGGYSDSEGGAQGKWITEFSNGDTHIGEWKDNRMHGQGTYTYADGEQYVGEYKNGLMHGQGTYTFAASGNKYVGEFKYDNRHGQGTFTFLSGDQYIGEYKENKRHGAGTFFYKDGSKVSGAWIDGKLNGYAIQYNADGSIFREGIFKNDEFIYAGKRNLPTSDLPDCPSTGFFHNCFGTYIWEENGDQYVGEWKDGEQSGQGTYTWANGDKYIGEHRNNKRNGQGTYTYADGDQYIGKFKNGIMHGQGTYIFGPSSEWAGDKYVGEYRDGKKHGRGTYTFSSASKWAGDKFIGEFKDDQSNGQGSYLYSNGDKFTGEYRDGKRNGSGTYTYADGRIEVGVWKDGKFLYAQKFPTNSSSSGNLKLDKNKEFCEEIGFIPGSEKFAECVMVLIDTD